MHQPYYKNLLTQEVNMPWVRLHGVKDYLDMVEMLENYPKVHLTFNLVSSLLEQIEDYVNYTVKDKSWELSSKPAAELTAQDKEFILQNFFSTNKERLISIFPRYYELYFKKQKKAEFNLQDYLDLQVWFNLAWIDPIFRQNTTPLANLVNKARFFTEQEKYLVLDKQREILEKIIPTYKKFLQNKQIEVTISPYYHPILPLIYNTHTAKEANVKSILPKVKFSYPEDVKNQIDLAVRFHQDKFSELPGGMWPSEQSVSEHILPFIIESGIKWIIADEAILFKSLKKKRRDTALLYQPYLLRRKDGNLNIIFRDRNLSDLIGFVYYSWSAKDAVNDFMKHLENIYLAFKEKDILVTVAMDGENAWEYFANDGHDFLETLYQRLSETSFLKTVTVSEYLAMQPGQSEIKRLATGSWIYANFDKWMGNPYKAKAWEWLALAREELERANGQTGKRANELAWKQIYICEGSDWFWWYGENHADFDRLFRMHLTNFYTLIDKDIPQYLNTPLTT